MFVISVAATIVVTSRSESVLCDNLRKPCIMELAP
jgi:hypothetical protein